MFLLHTSCKKNLHIAKKNNSKIQPILQYRHFIVGFTTQNKIIFSNLPLNSYIKRITVYFTLFHTSFCNLNKLSLYIHQPSRQYKDVLSINIHKYTGKNSSFSLKKGSNTPIPPGTLLKTRNKITTSGRETYQKYKHFRRHFVAGARSKVDIYRPTLSIALCPCRFPMTKSDNKHKEYSMALQSDISWDILTCSPLFQLVVQTLFDVTSFSPQTLEVSCFAVPLWPGIFHLLPVLTRKNMRSVNQKLSLPKGHGAYLITEINCNDDNTP